MPIQQGVNQQTPAAQNVWRAMGRAASRAVGRKVRKRVKSTVKKAVRRASGKKSGGKLKRFVKGSAEAKRFMAKLRRMRKK